MEHLDLPASASAARTGRAFVSAYCRRHHLPVRATEDAVLLTSELLSNAYLHARSATVVSVGLLDRTLRVEVADDSETQPEPPEAGPSATGGRGMRLIDTLAQRWGVRRHPGGKSVWFELPDTR
jgi:anti-sigma regulatory factor (Ser/Thr protein kinase)